MKPLALALTALLALSSVAHAASPVGQVTADCTHVEGWAQDPDDPAAIVPVHLYFDGPAGDPLAVGLALTADLTLRVGCRGDQCTHGFRAVLPLSRLDGQPHPVHAYGIDAVDPNLELGLSPTSYTCPPLPIVTGVKRHIVSPTVLDQWKFSTYFDMMKVADLALAAVPEGPLVDVAPQLVLAEGTDAPLWLVDHGFRRLLAPEVIAAWRFDPATATLMPAAALDELPEGTPLAARPILAQGSAAAVYLLDDHQCLEGDLNPACPEPIDPTTGTTGSETTGPGTTGPDPTTGTTGPQTTGLHTTDPGSSGGSEATTTAPDTAGPSAEAPADGCGCRSTPGPGPWALLLALAIPRRRRPRRPVPKDSL